MTLGKSFPFSGSLFPFVKWWESRIVSLARLPRGAEGTKVLLKESESGSVVSDSLQPHGLYSPWNSPGHNTGVGSLSLLQGIFPSQEWNPGLPHCRRILYQLSLKGSPLNSLKLKGRCLKLGVVAILRVPLDCHSWRHTLCLVPHQPQPWVVGLAQSRLHGKGWKMKEPAPQKLTWPPGLLLKDARIAESAWTGGWAQAEPGA